MARDLVITRARKDEAGADWFVAGRRRRRDGLGSIEDHTPGAERALLFGWWGEQPGVWLASLGEGNRREILDSDELLADLRYGAYRAAVTLLNGARMHFEWTIS